MKIFWIKIISHVLFLAGMLAFFYGFLLAPQREYVYELNRKIHDRVGEMEANLDPLYHIEEESIFLDRLKEDIETRRKRFVAQNRIIEAGWELTSWIREAGFRPIRLIPPIGDREGKEMEVSSSGNLRILEFPLIIEMEGSYLECGRFLESLQQYPFHVVPGRISMASSRPGNSLLDIKLELYIYVLEEVPTDEV